MPVSERKAAAKEVDAVFSAAAVAETRGGGGEGGERRQRATGVRDNRVDGREAGTEEAFALKVGPVEGDGDFQAMAAAENGVEGEGCGRRCWAWTQGRRTDEKRPSGNRERRRRWLGLCGAEKETEKKEEAEFGSRDRRVDEDGDEADGDGEE